MIGDSCLGTFNFWYIRKYLWCLLKQRQICFAFEIRRRKSSSLLNWFFKCALSISNLTTLKSTKLSLREKCPNTEFVLVRIFLYSVRIQENTDQKKIRIWTLFVLCFFAKWSILDVWKGSEYVSVFLYSVGV